MFGAPAAAGPVGREQSAGSPGETTQQPLPGPTNGQSPQDFTGVGKSSRFERWMLKSVLKLCGDPAIRVVLWDGEAVCTSAAPPIGSVVIRDRATLRRMALQPIVAFGDGYGESHIDIEGNLVDVLCAMSSAVDQRRPDGVVGRIFNPRPKLHRPHTIDASRDSVYRHYDLGNSFYKLWLDENLSYTCAYFSTPNLSLEAAQIAKFDHICRKLRLRPGDRVIEAGCGWGGLALHMAKRYGVTVRAFNLSHEQIVHARDWAKSLALDDRVEFVEDDYRNITGTCDAFASVGMLEHVGLENYRELGRVIDGVLTPAGRGVIHSIGRNAPMPLDPWIDKRIFPGAYPPALSEMMQIFEPWQMSVLDIENIRLHYVCTLRHWLERYEKSLDEIVRMFDVRFARMWRLYLAGSIAAFSVGSLQLFQVVFTRAANNDLPWTRAYMYPGAENSA
jgi:cyclopropane-fatty-acyl-phospholipid synthase